MFVFPKCFSWDCCNSALKEPARGELEKLSPDQQFLHTVCSWPAPEDCKISPMLDRGFQALISCFPVLAVAASPMLTAFGDMGQHRYRALECNEDVKRHKYNHVQRVMKQTLGPTEGNKGEEGAGASLLWEKIEGEVQCQGETSKKGPHPSLSVFAGGSQNMD